MLMTSHSNTFKGAMLPPTVRSFYNTIFLWSEQNLKHLFLYWEKWIKVLWNMFLKPKMLLHATYHPSRIRVKIKIKGPSALADPGVLGRVPSWSNFFSFYCSFWEIIGEIIAFTFPPRH